MKIKCMSVTLCYVMKNKYMSYPCDDGQIHVYVMFCDKDTMYD